MTKLKNNLALFFFALTSALLSIMISFLTSASSRPDSGITNSSVCCEIQILLFLQNLYKGVYFSYKIYTGVNIFLTKSIQGVYIFLTKSIQGSIFFLQNLYRGVYFSYKNFAQNLFHLDVLIFNKPGFYYNDISPKHVYI